jgi:hypothetical protein
MIFKQFIEKTNKHLKSVRVLKNYVSFDMTFPTTWSMLKTNPEGLEVLQNTDQNGLITTSFVCLNEAEQINQLERVMDIIISTNIEREEKEKLFKSKVQELQTIFEKENLENLKGLKFDIDQLVNLYKNNDDEISIGDEKSVEQTA